MITAEKFMQAITREQLTEFIDGVFDHLQPEQLKILFSTLNPELNAVFSAMTTEPKAEEAEHDAVQIQSNSKISEKWYSLAGDIETIIEEVGDEEGNYASQEHHWEQPCFDEYSLSSDLDEVFTKMLPLLKHCFDNELESKDYFRTIIADINDAIGGYPEWFGAEYNEFCFDKAGSECLLYWNWLNRESITQFIDVTLADFKQQPLTSKFTPTCFINEPLATLKELYHALSNKLSAEILNAPKSFWHPIYHLTQGVADRKSFLKSSAALMGDNWQYGITVYEELMQNGEFKQAEHYCARTVAECFRQNAYGEDFNTNFATTIYPIHSQLAAEADQLDKVFADWNSLCHSLQLDDKLWAIAVQQQFYRNPNDWSQILQLFTELHSTPFFTAYLADLKYYVSHKIISDYSDKTSTWIASIVDFALDNQADVCMKQLIDWLYNLRLTTNGNYLYQQLFYLSKYSFDLDAMPNYPVLTRSLQQNIRSYYGCSYNNSEDNLKPWVKFIQFYIQQLDLATLQQQLLQVWQREICKIVPDLTVTDGRYEEHAKWLALAMELNPKPATNILNKWRNIHRLKRNLWTSLAAYGIKKKV